MPDTGSPPTGDRLQDRDEFAAPRSACNGRGTTIRWTRAWSLTARPGWLRLTALPADHLVTARNTLTQILQGPRTTDHHADRRARHGRGPARRPRHVRRAPELDRRGAQRRPQPRHPRHRGRGDRRARADAAATVELRVEVGARADRALSYSLDDGRTFQPFGEPIPLARFSWWKGSRPALFSFVRPAAEGRRCRAGSTSTGSGLNAPASDGARRVSSTDRWLSASRRETFASIGSQKTSIELAEHEGPHHTIRSRPPSGRPASRWARRCGGRAHRVQLNDDRQEDPDRHRRRRRGRARAGAQARREIWPQAPRHHPGRTQPHPYLEAAAARGGRRFARRQSRRGRLSQPLPSLGLSLLPRHAGGHRSRARARS